VNKAIRRLACVLATFTALLAGQGTQAAERKFVFVTFDGVRWQDVFRGADPALVADTRFMNADIKDDVVAPAYLAPKDRGAALMPFLHGVIARKGVLIGNRDRGECAQVANDMWISYPGYNEFLTGKPDPAIVENDKIWNPNVSFLEYLNGLPAYRTKVAMVGTWTLFPYILNTKRSGLPVNVGFHGSYPTDIRTEREGLKLLQRHDQRVVYIAFGDTDEFAHAGDYAYYLGALERGDEYLRQVWQIIQSHPFYRDQTTLMVSTDHGRGDRPIEAWQDHSAPRYHQLNPTYQPQYNETGVTGSGNVWMAAIGPAVKPEGAEAYRHGACAYSKQIAASAVTALGEDWKSFNPDSEPLAFIAAP
jgi:hypothetical protein